MPIFKNKLDALLADAVLASGVSRNVVLNQIRNYLKTVPVDQLKKEIAVITSKPELTMLQAAGIPAPIQEVFLFTFQQLQGS